MEKMYIGRTAAYYDGDDDGVFTPEFWTYSEDKNDKEFAGEVHKLNEDGIRELNWWIECRRMNGYQRNHCFGYRRDTKDQMWKKLTNPSNGYLASDEDEQDEYDVDGWINVID